MYSQLRCSENKQSEREIDTFNSRLSYMLTSNRISLDSIPETYCNKIFLETLTLWSVETMHGRVYREYRIH